MNRSTDQSAGNEHRLLGQSQVGDSEFTWLREYGTTFRISSCYGVSSHLNATAQITDDLVARKLLHSGPSRDSAYCSYLGLPLQEACRCHSNEPQYVRERYPLGIGYGLTDRIDLLFNLFRLSGNMHKRHRKVVNPAFAAQQLRGFLPLFQTIGSRVSPCLFGHCLSITISLPDDQEVERSDSVRGR